MHIHSRQGGRALVSLPVAWAATADPTVFVAEAGGAVHELRAAAGPTTRWRVYRNGVPDGVVLTTWPTHMHGYVPLVVALGGAACACGCTARVKASVAANV